MYRKYSSVHIHFLGPILSLFPALSADNPLSLTRKAPCSNPHPHFQNCMQIDVTLTPGKLPQKTQLYTTYPVDYKAVVIFYVALISWMYRNLYFVVMYAIPSIFASLSVGFLLIE